MITNSEKIYTRVAETHNVRTFVIVDTKDFGSCKLFDRRFLCMLKAAKESKNVLDLQ